MRHVLNVEPVHQKFELLILPEAIASLVLSGLSRIQIIAQYY
ncbi:hypothetical protein [Scytonema sp. UIC 10036]